MPIWLNNRIVEIPIAADLSVLGCSDLLNKQLKILVAPCPTRGEAKIDSQPVSMSGNGAFFCEILSIASPIPESDDFCI